MRTDCPKCYSHSAWYSRTAQDLILRCLCGLHKVMYSVLDEMEIMHSDAGADVKLPRPGTHLRKTLLTLECLEEASTAEIAERLKDLGQGYSMSDVASYLTILRSKGLVCSPVIRRGVAGGSTWTLTDNASDLLSKIK